MLAGTGEANRRAAGIAVGAAGTLREAGRRPVQLREIDHVQGLNQLEGELMALAGLHLHLFGGAQPSDDIID